MVSAYEVEVVETCWLAGWFGWPLGTLTRDSTGCANHVFVHKGRWYYFDSMGEPVEAVLARELDRAWKAR